MRLSGLMPATLSGLRPLVPDDLAWVLHLCELRRKRIAGYAVRLWRPAPGGRDHHRVFLSHQIQDPRVLSLRTDHGFVFAAPRADLLDVDDMGLDDDDRWPDDGIRLLQAVLQRSDARFVCPVPEPARTQTAVAAGMQLAESWWHRDLPTTDPPTTATAPVDDPILDVPGASGRLVQAPPVYAPGGSVLLVLQVDSENALTAIEDAAIAAGAVVSVVPLLPNQHDDLLTDAGYKRTTDFFVSRRWQGCQPAAIPDDHRPGLGTGRVGPLKGSARGTCRCRSGVDICQLDERLGLLASTTNFVFASV